MTATKNLSLWLILFHLTACAPAIKISSDFNESFDFSSISTYHLLEGDPSDVSKSHGLSLADQRVQTELKAAFEARNILAESKNEASVWVSYVVTTKDKQRVRQTGNDFFYGVHGKGSFASFNFGSRESVQDYKEGHLAIDFISPESEHVIWRGIARRELKGDLPLDSKQAAKDYIDALFETVPGWLPISENETQSP